MTYQRYCERRNQVASAYERGVIGRNRAYRMLASLRIAYYTPLSKEPS